MMFVYPSRNSHVVIIEDGKGMSVNTDESVVALDDVSASQVQTVIHVAGAGEPIISHNPPVV